MVARVVPQSARRRHAESRKPDLRGVVAGGRWPVLARLSHFGLSAGQLPVRRVQELKIFQRAGETAFPAT